MVKRKKTDTLKKILLIYLALMVFLPSLFSTGTMTVLAEEGENLDEEEVEEDDEGIGSSDILSTAGNIYNLGEDIDGSTRRAMETAAKYDIRMQYLVTYAFLSDKYGNTNAGSKYNQIYYGGHSGYNENLRIQTNPEAIYASMSGNNNDGSAHDDPTATGPDRDEEFGEAIKNLAGLLGNTLGAAATAAVGTTKEEREGVYLIPKHDIYGFSNIFELEDLDSYMNNVPRSPKDVGRSNAMSFLIEKYTELVARKLEGGLLTEDEIIEELLTLTNYSTLQMIVDQYREQELSKIGKSSTGYSIEVLKSRDIPTGFRNDIYKWYGNMGLPTDKGIVGLHFGGVDLNNEEEYGIILALLPEYAKLLQHKHEQLSYDGAGSMILNQSRNDVISVVKEDTNGIVEKYLDSTKGLADEDEEIAEHLGTDTAILSWIPMYPHFTLANLEAYRFPKIGASSVASFEEAILNIEGSIYRNEKLYTSENKRRTIRINDLFYSDDAASPVLTLDTEFNKNEYAEYTAGWGQQPLYGTSIGKYAGISTINVEDESFWKGFSNFTVGRLLKDFKFQEAVMRRHNPKEDSYNVKMARSLAAHGDKYDISMDVEKAQFVGVDTYGNIINTTTGTILIPYWQNETIPTLGVLDTKDTGAWVSHAAYTQGSTTDVVGEVVNNEDIRVFENTITDSDVSSAFGSYLPGGSPNVTIPEPVNVSKIHELVTNGGQGGQLNQETIHALAVKIVAGTHNEVREWNEEAIERGKASGELFIETNVGEYSGDNTNALDGYTNADLRERIMMILDYGFYEVLKSTVASLVVAIYNSGWVHFTMSAVFHTITLADTAVWDDLIRSVAILIIGLLGLYLVIMAFHVFRGTMRIKDFVLQFLIVTFIILIPSVIYAPTVNLLINKPTPLVLGHQMQQMTVLDYYLHDRDNQIDRDPVYAQLFGGNVEARDRSQDYMIDFYTTQHKSGFDVNSAMATEGLSFRDRVRSANAERTGEWNKSDLVKVSVSAFDLYDWAKHRVDANEETRTNADLFTWLAYGDGTSYRYPGVGEYTEYSYDPNIINRNLGILAGDVDEETITASELFIQIYEASSPITNDGRNLSERLQNMIQISAVAKNRDPLNPVSVDEINGFIRDMSLTRGGRESVFGTTDLSSYNVSKVTRNTPDISRASLELWQRVGRGETLTLANSDYLNLESIMYRVKPETNDPREVPNDRHIYKINEKTLNDYINVTSVVRETVGEAVRNSEFMAITLGVFFNLNEELDLPMFPTEIKPETISLDTFARMVYTPIAEYQNAEAAGIDNIAEYLTLRDNPILLLFTFIPALVVLTLWGLIYLVVFGAILLILSVTMFIWNYVIKRDVTNKSWFGTLMVIVSFAIAKIGLLGLWFVMAYWMNSQYALFGGATYLYSAVHSIIIIAYVFFAMKFLITKVLVPVAKSPGDIGGQQMMDNIGDSFRKSVNRLKGQGKKKSGEGGGKEGKKAIDEALDNEGEEGKADLDGVNSPIRRVLNKLRGRDSDVAGDISEALSSQNSPELDKYAKHTKGFGGKAKRGMYGAFETIPAIAQLAGAAPELMETLAGTGSYGQVLSTTADGVQLAKMAVGNAAQATRIADHLTKQGINAKVNDSGDVVFDTTDTDLSSPEVRKNLYGGLTNDLLTEIDELPQILAGEEANAMSYNTNKDGTASITVGSTGLSTASLDTLLDSKAFTDSFIVEGTPAKDENGEYIQGSLDVVARDGVDTNKAMEKIFSLDEKVRKSAGEDARSVLAENRAFEYAGLGGMDEVTQYMEEGMKLQGDKVLYDINNRKHRRAIKSMETLVNSSLNQEEVEKKNLMDRLIAQTVYGGNAGVGMDYVNTSQDPNVQRDAKSAGLVDDAIRTSVYAGENEKRVAEQIKSVKNLSGLTGTEIGQYYTSQDQLFRAGEDMLVQGNGEDRYDKALSKLAKMGTGAGASEKMINETMDKYKELGKKRNNAEMLPEEYANEVEGLYADLQLSMQEEGVYAKALSTEINKNKKAPKEVKEALNNFVKSKRNLSDKGVSVDVVEKLDQEQFTEMAEMLDDISDVNVRGDGVISIESGSRLDDKDIARLVEKMKDLDKD